MPQTWLGCSVRRLGRVGLGLVAFVAGCVAFVAVSAVNLLVVRLWFVKICGAIGLATMAAVVALFDRLGVVPDVSDPPTTLSLTECSTGPGKQ